jgi:hypothetical protein
VGEAFSLDRCGCKTAPTKNMAATKPTFLEAGYGAQRHPLDNVVGRLHSFVFPNRSKAIQAAVEDKLIRLDKSRLAQECAKLDRAFEQTLAEEGLSSELEEWPQY